MLLSSTNFLFWKARRELWGGLTTRCFPSKEDKDMFIFEFFSPFNLGMYIINKLFDGYFACTIFIHLLCKYRSAHQPWNNL